MKPMTTEKRIQNIEARLADLESSQDFPWYWISYGEKCYAYATVAAFPERDDDEDKLVPACELVPHQTKDRVWVASDGTPMLVEDEIASNERQSGRAVCGFIAHSREDIQFLLDTIYELRARLADAPANAPH